MSWSNCPVPKKGRNLWSNALCENQWRKGRLQYTLYQESYETIILSFSLLALFLQDAFWILLYIDFFFFCLQSPQKVPVLKLNHAQSSYCFLLPFIKDLDLNDFCFWFKFNVGIIWHYPESRKCKSKTNFPPKKSKHKFKLLNFFTH